MHLGVRYDGPAERVGAALNLVPRPIGMSLFAMPLARSLQVAQSTGFLGLFFHLTSGADTYSQGQVGEWLARSGFGSAKARTFAQLPGLGLLRAERLA